MSAKIGAGTGASKSGGSSSAAGASAAGGAAMSGMVLASMFSAFSNQEASQAMKVADAKLQREQLRLARIRASDDYQTNMSRAKQAAGARTMQIQENRLDARAQADATFADSGLSGGTIDEIDNQIESRAASNRVKNVNSLDAQLADQTKNFSHTMNDNASQTDNINTTYEGLSFLDTAMVGVQAGLSGAMLL